MHLYPFFGIIKYKTNERKMIMLQQQQKLIFSPYVGIYDIVVPKDNMLRQINELVDFSFVYDELADKYCQDNGRNAVCPIRMFKYLLLKSIFDLSDKDIVERSKYDMSFKYFLDMTPEENVINYSSLTKFRKLRLKDVNLLDILINKTVAIALDKGVINSHSMIVDATHTRARYNQKSPREILQERSKQLRKSIYKLDETMKNEFPAKNIEDNLEKEIAYCSRLVSVVKEHEELMQYPMISQTFNLLEEILQDDIEHLRISEDKDAKIGHKTADTSFFGYKTHIAMTEERIITAVTITTGEKNDGKELEALYEKSKKAGMTIDTIIGDTAYSEKANIELARKEDIKLVAKLNPCLTQGLRKEEDKFQFNKDAGMYVCKNGHMAIRKASNVSKGTKHNPVDKYFFDIKKCKVCPLREGCYKEGAKSKTYSVTIKSDMYKSQIAFQESEYFKEKSKERYKIEAKNSEIKHRHGYDVASSSGLIGMEIQGATAMFAVNLKRILKLLVVE